MSTIGETLEEACGLPDELFALFGGLLDFDDAARGEGGYREGFGSVDHEYCELELEVRVLGFLCIGAIEFEGALVGKEGGLVAWAEMGVVEDGTRGWRRCAERLCCDGV